MDAKKPIVVSLALTLASFLAVWGLAGCVSKTEPDRLQQSHRTLYVSGSPGCAGRSPCYACIQDAVDAASDSDVIKVAEGVYTATASQVVLIDKGVELIGGFPADDWSSSRSGAQPTVVDAEQVAGRRGISIDGRRAATITIRDIRVRRGNTEKSGGGVYVAGGSVILEGNVIEASRAAAGGGGLFIADGRVHLIGNALHGNAAQRGGALHVEGGRVLLDQNIFRGNQAAQAGGAIAINGGVVTGTNNLLVQNPLAGTGVYLSGGHLTGSHWTLVDNGRYGVIADLGIDIDSGSVTLRKSIIASHKGGLCGAGAKADQTLFHRVDHPCIAGASCVNNLFGDPKFADPETGDYHIGAESAAVDRGFSVDVVYDIDGDTRPVGRASDIGADELVPERVYLPLVTRLFGWRGP